MDKYDLVYEIEKILDKNDCFIPLNLDKNNYDTLYKYYNHLKEKYKEN